MITRNIIACAARLVLGLSLALGTFAEAQNVITLQQSGPVHISRNVNWSMAANGAPGIAFVWQTTPGTNYACFMVQNNSQALTHSGVQLSGWVTTDPKVNIIALPTGAPSGNLQNSAYIFKVYQTPLQNFSSFVAGQVYAYTGYFTIGGAAQAVVNISGAVGTAGASTDTLDFTEVDSQAPCPNMNAAIFGTTNYGGYAGSLRPCMQVVGLAQAATASGTVISQGASLNTGNAVYNFAPRYHICSISISGPNTTNSAAIGIQMGTSASACPTTIAGGALGWAWQTAAAGVLNINLSAPGELFSLPAANALCLVNAGTGTTISASVAFDVY